MQRDVLSEEQSFSTTFGRHLGALLLSWIEPRYLSLYWNSGWMCTEVVCRAIDSSLSREVDTLQLAYIQGQRKRNLFLNKNLCMLDKHVLKNKWLHLSFSYNLKNKNLTGKKKKDVGSLQPSLVSRKFNKCL